MGFEVISRIASLEVTVNDSLTKSVEAIFSAALEKPSAAERADYLQEACGSDVELRGEVERLLSAAPKVGAFLDLPLPLATVDSPLVEGVGMQIGPYKLLEQIGEGGMGDVFMAEQQHPIRRKVALKVIKPGMDSRQVLVRFEVERQALALMDHPNIAHVFDGGSTDSGRPFFVMELVRGTPITDYCDQQRLSPRERLELFIQVCHAVQHAHQKGIVHRDIKPSNVMITLHDERPVAKVIDFGIAKAMGGQLTDKTLFTNFAQMIGTPLYMSPEQAGLSGLDVDTRSDIYSLGVLLYELLTGTTPLSRDRLKEADYDEVRRIIREEEPPKPSTRVSTLGQAASTVSSQRRTNPKQLSRLFRGDLDWIVLKALEKDRNRRYESASVFARDVQRYLLDEPVLARPASALYRLGKWTRRRPALAALYAVSAVALLVVVALLLAHLDNLAQRASMVTDLGKARSELNDIEGQRDFAQTEQKQAEQRIGELNTKIGGLDKEKATITKQRADLDVQLDADKRDRFAITLARAADLFQSEPQRALDLLDDPRRCPENCRDFSWGLLHRLNTRLRQTLEGHDAPVQCLVISPDGQTLASGAGAPGNNKGDAKLWELATGRLRSTLTGHSDGVLQIVFSPDGKSLATLGGQVKVWDAAGKEKYTLQREGSSPRAIQFTADSRTLIVKGYNCEDKCEVTLWESETGKLMKDYEIPVPGKPQRYQVPRDVAVCHEGKWLAVASGANGVRIFKLPNVTDPVATLDHGDAVGVEFAPTDPLLAAGGKQLVKVWNYEDEKWREREWRSLDGSKPDAFNSYLTWSPDSSFLVTWGAGGIVWEPRTRRKVVPKFWADPAFSPDGKIIAHDGITLNLATGQREVLPRTNGLFAVAPAGKILASAPTPFRRHEKDDRVGSIKLWNIGVSLEAEVLPGPEDAQPISAGGKAVDLDRDKGVAKVWNVFSGKLEGEVPRTEGIGLAPDGKAIIVLGKGKNVLEVWDVASRKQRGILDHKADMDTETSYLEYPPPATAVRVFSPDSKLLATVTVTGQLHIWDLAECKEQTPLSSKFADWLAKASASGQQKDTRLRIRTDLGAFSADGKLFAWPDMPPSFLGPSLRPGPGGALPPPPRRVPRIGPDLPGEVVLVDVATGERLGSLTAADGKAFEAKNISRVIFSPDGKTLFTIGDNEAFLWDVATRRLRFALPGDDVPPSAGSSEAAFSPDGATLATLGGGRFVLSDRSGSYHWDLKLWDVATGTLRSKVTFPVSRRTDRSALPEDYLPRIAFSPDGKALLTGLTLRDPITGQARLQLPLENENWATATAVFSADGRALAIAHEGRINIWRIDPDAQETKKRPPN
jgi:serine/threonine protein kinase/WD40 repeat protein